MTRSHVSLPVVMALAAALVACGPANRVQSGSSPTSPAGLKDDLIVFAAASLSNAFSLAEKKLETTHSGLHATYSFAGSQQLVQNVIDGAAADVVATADMATMQRLVSAGLVGAPRIFAHNVLEIAVAPGNPKNIRTLADLARADVAVVLADPSVPAGRYAVQMLDRAGVSVTPRSLELNVETALERVESGDADAAVVYRTDVIGAAGRVDGVTIPSAANVVAAYPIAVVEATQNLRAAQAFVTEAVSGAVHAELLSEGFLTP